MSVRSFSHIKYRSWHDIILVSEYSQERKMRVAHVFLAVFMLSNTCYCCVWHWNSDRACRCSSLSSSTTHYDSAPFALFFSHGMLSFTPEVHFSVLTFNGLNPVIVTWHCNYYIRSCWRCFVCTFRSSLVLVCDSASMPSTSVTLYYTHCYYVILILYSFYTFT